MKLIVILLALVAFAYTTYAAFLTLSEYFRISYAVEQAGANTGTDRGKDRVAEVRAAVLRDGRATGVPLEDQDVVVTEQDRTLKISVRWSHPVLVIRGEPVFAIPVWVERAIAPKAEATPAPR